MAARGWGSWQLTGRAGGAPWLWGVKTGSEACSGEGALDLLPRLLLLVPK